MRLKIQYDDSTQIINLDDQSTNQLWVSLSLEGEGLSDDEKEQMIQDTIDGRFNRPEYNNWHKFDRHRGYSKAKASEDGSEEAADTYEPLISEVADSRIFFKDELEWDEQASYDVICAWICEVLVKKPDWADAFIAVEMNGESIRHYAARTGASENNISQKLKRAKKRLATAYPENGLF